MTSIRLIESSSAQLRLDEARAFVETHAARGDVWLVGASRGAVDDLARAIATATGATIGLHRFSLTQLAARLAAPDPRGPQGSRPSPTSAPKRSRPAPTFEAQRDAALNYFAPVAKTPGFPRALARTLQELRLAEVGADRLAALPLGGPISPALLERFDEQFANASATDRATLFDAATEALRSGGWQRRASPAPGRRRCSSSTCRSTPTVEFDFVKALLGQPRHRDSARSAPRRTLARPSRSATSPPWIA